MCPCRAWAHLSIQIPWEEPLLIFYIQMKKLVTVRLRQQQRRARRRAARRRKRRRERHSARFRRKRRRMTRLRHAEQARRASRDPTRTSKCKRRYARQPHPNGTPALLPPKHRTTSKAIFGCHQVMLQSLQRRNRRVVDVHGKSVNFLTKHHIVFYPKFPWQKLLRRAPKGVYGNGHLSSKQRRELYSLSHSKLYMRLLLKAQEVGCCVIECKEWFTSKMCSRCAIVNPNLGASRSFTCANPFCGFTCHRDVNGAMNILTRALGHVVDTASEF